MSSDDIGDDVDVGGDVDTGGDDSSGGDAADDPEDRRSAPTVDRRDGTARCFDWLPGGFRVDSQDSRSRCVSGAYIESIYSELSFSVY